MKKITSPFSFFILISALVPLASFAQTASSTGICNNSITDIASLLGYAACLIIKAVVPLLIALAVVVFIYGIVQYILNADNEEKRQQGRTFMMYGIIALFVMISIWGLVQVLANTFHINTVIPQLQSQ